MIVDVQLQFRQVLSCNSNVSVGDCENIVAISSRPGADSRDGVARQAIHRQGVHQRKQVRTGNAQVGHRRSRHHVLWCRGTQAAGLKVVAEDGSPVLLVGL